MCFWETPATHIFEVFCFLCIAYYIAPLKVLKHIQHIMATRIVLKIIKFTTWWWKFIWNSRQVLRSCDLIFAIQGYWVHMVIWLILVKKLANRRNGNSSHSPYPDDIINDIIKTKNLYIRKVWMGPTVTFRSSLGLAVSGLCHWQILLCYICEQAINKH